jgi:hypothetical protein
MRICHHHRKGELLSSPHGPKVCFSRVTDWLDSSFHHSLFEIWARRHATHLIHVCPNNVSKYTRLNVRSTCSGWAQTLLRHSKVYLHKFVHKHRKDPFVYSCRNQRGEITSAMRRVGYSHHCFSSATHNRLQLNSNHERPLLPCLGTNMKSKKTYHTHTRAGYIAYIGSKTHSPRIAFVNLLSFHGRKS